MSLFVHAALLTFSTSSAVQLLHQQQTASTEFKQYAATFGRDYKEGTSEFTERQALYQQRMRVISEQNSRPHRLWTAEVNALTDRTDSELAYLRGWRHVNTKAGHGVALMSSTVRVVKKPAEEVDWRSLSYARTVPDQGACGSCWAVATATMLQGRYEVQVNGSRTFSAQQLVDCVPNPTQCGGSGGCNGATVELAMKYVARMGLHDEITQPYYGMDRRCQDSGFGRFASFFSFPTRVGGDHHSESAFGLKTWHRLPENKALPLMLAVMEGPVAISVAASEWSVYGSGIFDGCAKDAVIDHAVALFGYGVQQGVHYWTIRNSWGVSWGERGFIRLLRQDSPEADDEYCGTDHDPSAGTACKPYPKAVKVCGMCGLLYDSVVAHFK